MRQAQIVCLVARACPGLFTHEFIRYHLPPEQAWAYVHTDSIMRGIPHVWRDAADNPDIVWWRDEVLNKFKR